MPKSSTLAAAIAAAAKQPGPACTIRVLLERLPAAQRQDLTTALGDALMPATAIARGLTSIGHKTSQYAIQRHRRGDCNCP